MTVKPKLINLSSELTDALGRVGYLKNISGNGVVIIAIEEFVQRHFPDTVWKDYQKSLSEKYKEI